MRIVSMVCLLIAYSVSLVSAGSYTVGLTPDQEMALKVMEQRAPKGGAAHPMTVQMLVDRALERGVAQIQAKKKAEAKASTCARLKGSSYQADKDAAAVLCE